VDTATTVGNYRAGVSHGCQANHRDRSVADPINKVGCLEDERLQLADSVSGRELEVDLLDGRAEVKWKIACTLIAGSKHCWVGISGPHDIPLHSMVCNRNLFSTRAYGRRIDVIE